MIQGFCANDGEEYYCDLPCLEKELVSIGVKWEFTDEENSEGGFITLTYPDGDVVPWNIYWTEWEDYDEEFEC